MALVRLPTLLLAGKFDLRGVGATSWSRIQRFATRRSLLHPAVSCWLT